MERRFFMNRIFNSIFLGLSVVLLASCQSKSNEPMNQESTTTTAITPESISATPVETVANSDDHKKLTLEEFNKEISSEKLSMVDFYTTWCGPCKQMAPFVAEIKAEKSDIVNVIKVDAEAQLDISSKYNLEGYPTIIFFKKGEVIFKQLGALDKEGLLQLVNKYK
jgi:thioredoxin 1